MQYSIDGKKYYLNIYSSLFLAVLREPLSDSTYGFFRIKKCRFHEILMTTPFIHGIRNPWSTDVNKIIQGHYKTEPIYFILLPLLSQD